MPLKNNKMIMALIFIVIIATTILAQNTSKNKNVQTKGSTLKQAISIGIIEAKKWNTSAELAQVISTDAGDQTSGIRGINGKRKIWNIIFIEPKTNSQAVDDACRDFGVKTVSYYWEEYVN